MKRAICIVAFLLLCGRNSTQAQITNSNISLLGYDWTAVVSKPVVQSAYTNPAASKHATNLIPLISFQDLPISYAVENLAREAGINYLIDPRVEQQWMNPPSYIEHEPTLNVRVENVTAKEELESILSDHDLKLVAEPISGIAIVTLAGQTLDPVDPTLLNLTTNTSPDKDLYTNGVIPLIKFSDVPMTAALDGLFRQAGLEYRLNPGTFADGEPTIRLNWTNLTAKQAILGVCEAYHLMLVADDTDGVIRVQSAPVKRHHHLLLQ